MDLSPRECVHSQEYIREHYNQRHGLPEVFVLDGIVVVLMILMIIRLYKAKRLREFGKKLRPNINNIGFLLVGFVGVLIIGHMVIDHPIWFVWGCMLNEGYCSQMCRWEVFPNNINYYSLPLLAGLWFLGSLLRKSSKKITRR